MKIKTFKKLHKKCTQEMIVELKLYLYNTYGRPGIVLTHLISYK